MTTASEAARNMALDNGIGLSTSPLESIGATSTSTPDTDISPPGSPGPKQKALKSDRLWARNKVTQLTEEEKVS